MTIKKRKPTTPGQRGAVDVIRNVYKGRSLAKLTVKKANCAGRNNHGRITVRHRGGGHKRLYRLIDWRRNKFGVPGVVERIEYDPNRSAHIALICYMDGERRYMIAPDGLGVGDKVQSYAANSTNDDVSIAVGNAMALNLIPLGSKIHCVELKPGGGAQMARSAGASMQLLGRDGIYSQVRMRSNEVRKVLSSCMATIGEVGNKDHSLRSYGKAGAKRWRGIRPTVRGVAMNPIDHPHGGGEGKTAAGRPPVSPWGVQCKGYVTRKRNHRTNNMIITSRRRVRKKR